MTVSPYIPHQPEYVTKDVFEERISGLKEHIDAGFDGMDQLIEETKKETLTEIKRYVGGELGNIRGELGDVRGELADVRGELVDVRGELADVRGEMRGMRSELLAAIKSSKG